MANDRFRGLGYMPTMEDKIARLGDMVKVSGIANALNIAQDAIPGAKLDSRAGQCSNGIVIAPAWRLIGPWHVTRSGVMVPAEGNQLPGSENKKVTLIVEADPRQADEIGRTRFKLKAQVQSYYDCETDNDIIEIDRTSKTSPVGEIDLTGMAGWQAADNASRTTRDLLKIIDESGICPQKDRDAFYMALAAQGYYI